MHDTVCQLLYSYQYPMEEKQANLTLKNPYILQTTLPYSDWNVLYIHTSILNKSKFVIKDACIVCLI